MKGKKRTARGRFFFVSVRLSMAASGKGKFPAAGKAAEGVHQSMVFISKVSPVVVFQTMTVMVLLLPLPSSTLLPETATY